MKVFEGFAGDRSFGRICDERGYRVFSTDWKNYDNIDLVADLLTVKTSDIPFTPDYAHFSPDCTTYTIAAIKTHRRNQVEPFSDYAKFCDKVNKHMIALIQEWRDKNPNFKFTIENPRGVLHKMPWMIEFMESDPSFYMEVVWYCKYGDDRAKPTTIFTNIPNWKSRPQCKNFKYDSEGNIIDKHCHHQSARRGARTGTQGRKGSYERSMIPRELCEELLDACVEAEYLEMEYKLNL